MLSRITAVLSAALFAGSAGAQHTHCEVRPWGPIDLNPTPSQSFPIQFGGMNPPVNLMFSNFNIPLPRPMSSMPDCTYELSDITFIKITLTLSGGQLSFSSFSAGATSPTNAGPYLFTPQTSMITMTFNPHDAGAMGNTLTVNFPNPTISAGLSGGSSATLGGGEILGATLTLSGNHYFVPEPGSCVLLATAGVCVLRRRRGACA
jgi:hypothetical protein